MCLTVVVWCCKRRKDKRRSASAEVQLGGVELGPVGVGDKSLEKSGTVNLGPRDDSVVVKVKHVSS